MLIYFFFKKKKALKSYDLINSKPLFVKEGGRMHTREYCAASLALVALLQS